MWVCERRGGREAGAREAVCLIWEGGCGRVGACCREGNLHVLYDTLLSCATVEQPSWLACLLCVQAEAEAEC